MIYLNALKLFLRETRRVPYHLVYIEIGSWSGNKQGVLINLIYFQVHIHTGTGFNPTQLA